MKLTDILTSIGALMAGLGGLSWLATAIWRFFFGGEERRANAALAWTGATKIIVDELQEEVRAARAEARASRTETQAARGETEALRQALDELRRLTDQKIHRLEAENAELLRRISNGSR